MDYKKTAEKLQGILDFVDDHYDHKVTTYEVNGVIGFYDDSLLLCSEMTVRSFMALLEEYDGDAEQFYNLFEQDAASRGLPIRLDLVEIYPHNKSDRKFADSRFDDYREYEDCIIWDNPDNGLVIVLNTKTNVEAVYERHGHVYCLADRWCIYECIDMEDGYFAINNEIIREMLVKEAIGAGFPMECPV